MRYDGQLYKGPKFDCKGCEKRYPACHDYCESYQTALEAWLDSKRAIKHTKTMTKQFDQFKIEATIKNKRR